MPTRWQRKKLSSWGDKACSHASSEAEVLCNEPRSGGIVSWACEPARGGSHRKLARRKGCQERGLARADESSNADEAPLLEEKLL